MPRGFIMNDVNKILRTLQIVSSALPWQLDAAGVNVNNTSNRSMKTYGIDDVTILRLYTSTHVPNVYNQYDIEYYPIRINHGSEDIMYIDSKTYESEIRPIIPKVDMSEELLFQASLLDFNSEQYQRIACSLLYYSTDLNFSFQMNYKKYSNKFIENLFEMANVYGL